MSDFKLNLEQLSAARILSAIATPLVLVAMAWANLSGDISANTASIGRNAEAIKEVKTQTTDITETITDLDKSMALIQKDIAFIRKAMEER